MPRVQKRIWLRRTGGIEPPVQNRRGFGHLLPKTMETDPNGQISVTYTDMVGHTVCHRPCGRGTPNTDALLDQNANPPGPRRRRNHRRPAAQNTPKPNGTANTFFAGWHFPYLHGVLYFGQLQTSVPFFGTPPG